MARTEMDSFGDDHIARLLRLKRYEQPPPGYFENFLHEFHRRQRDELLRQPLWSICVDRMRDLVFGHNVRPLAGYCAGIAAAVASVAVISITLYQERGTQLAGQGSPVSSTPANTEKQLDSAPPVFIPPFDTQPTLLPGNRHIPVRRAVGTYLDSDQFVPLELERESLDQEYR